MNIPPYSNLYTSAPSIPRGDVDPGVAQWREWFRVNAQARRASLTKARVAQYQYQGIMSAYAGDDNIYISFDTVNRLGTMRFPLIPGGVDMVSAALMSDAILVEPVSTGVSTDDVTRRQAAALILDEFTRRNATRENNVELAKHLLITGRAFKQLYVQDQYVPVVMEPDVIPIYLRMKEDEMHRKGFKGYKARVLQNSISTLPDGRVRFSMCLPTIMESMVPSFNMLVETGCDELENCTQFAHFQYMNLRRAAELYADTGFDFDKLRPVSVYDKLVGDDAGYVGGGRTIQGQGDQSAERFGPEANQVRVYNCWQLVAPHEWVNTTIIQDGSGKAYHKIHEETREYHTYVGYGCRHTPGYFWDDGIVFDAVDPSRAYSLNATSLQRNFQQQMKDVVILDGSMRNEPVANTFGQVLYINSRAQMPQRLPMSTNAHLALMQLCDVYKNAVYESLGVSEAQRGITKSHTTEGGLQLISESSNNRLAMFYDKIVSQEIRHKYPLVLRMASSVYDEPRWMASTGSPDQSQVISRAVQGRDLGGIYDVVISTSIRMPSTTKERMELGITLSKNGLFSSPQEFNDFVQFQKGLLPINSSEMIERERARVENQWIQDGLAVPEGFAPDGTPGPVVNVNPGDPHNYGRPLMRPTDMHEIHIEEHTRAIREGGLPPDRSAAAMAHLSQHQVELNRIQEFEYAKALEKAALESQAKQSGQMVLQRMSDRTQMTNRTLEMIQQAQQTPADGGRKSGEVRRGETPTE